MDKNKKKELYEIRIKDYVIDNLITNSTDELIIYITKDFEIMMNHELGKIINTDEKFCHQFEILNNTLLKIKDEYQKRKDEILAHEFRQAIASQFNDSLLYSIVN